MGKTHHSWQEFSFLGAIILLGLVLRSYNLNFPSIGYHNMKENEYLSMAQEMIRTNDYASRKIYFYNAFENDSRMNLFPQPPLVSYQTLISWKILGENLWGPRLFNVMFGLASIAVIYFISLIVFRNISLSLFCAFLLAIMPLGVFFSRNLQPESPAFFFMLLGNLFYLKFIDSFKGYNLFLGGLAFSFAWLYKFSFIIGALPFVFCFPFKTLYKEREQLIRRVLILSLPYLIILAAVLWLKHIGQWQFNYQLTTGRVRLFDVFTFSYWKDYGHTIWWYTKAENYSLLFILLASSGILIAFFKRRRLLNRYIIGWTLSLIPYCMIFSDFINQHNYYQMPFLGLVCIAAVYPVLLISAIIEESFKRNLLIFLILPFVFLSIPFVVTPISRMFGTAFWGEDVAGETFRELTNPDERIFLLTHPQGYAIARYAQRYVGWPLNLEDFKNKEKKFNVRYICFFPVQMLASLKRNQPDMYNYIQDNYHFKEFGILEGYNQIVYFILEKGKGQNLEEASSSISGQMQLRTIYKSFGRYLFFYTVRPAIP